MTELQHITQDTLTIGELAALTGLTPYHIRKWAKRGKIDHFRPNRNYYFPMSAIEQAIYLKSGLDVPTEEDIEAA